MNQLVRPAHFLLLASLSLALIAFRSAGQSFTNSSTIAINDSPNPPTAASPYPSQLMVTGVAEPIAKVTVELDGFGHGWPNDVAVELVSPSGRNTLLFSNIGGAAPGASNIVLVLDDDAPGNLPFTGPLVSGTYKPTERYPITNSFNGFSFPAPAVPSPTNVALATFRGDTANGLWSLYVIDTESQHSGLIQNGWSISITPVPRLEIRLLGSQATVSWPVTASDYRLQSSLILTDPLGWTNVTTSPATNGSTLSLSFPLNQARSFFRLKK